MINKPIPSPVVKKPSLPISKSFLSPTLNTSPTNLPREKWKDMPGFEDEYQLSNYGRLRSLDRWVNMGRCDSFRPGRLIKLRLTSSAKKNARVTVDLQMKLHKDAKRYQFSVARYVYYLFVAPFDLEDHTVIITRRNGDKLNCHYRNLTLRSISDVATEGFTTKKRTSPFQLQSKPVTQYSLEGKKIRRYKNSKEASEATGISSEYINGSAKSAVRAAGGYFFRYGKSIPFINVSRYKRPANGSGKAKDTLEVCAKTSLYHYLNRDIKNIHGEKWKDIDGYQGSYQVSDHGRIKSLPRHKEIRTRTGKTACYWTREVIMKQALVKYLISATGEHSYYLTINLKIYSNYTKYSINHLVYRQFARHKGSIDSRRIVHLDGKYLNNHIANLRIAPNGG